MGAVFSTQCTKMVENFPKYSPAHLINRAADAVFRTKTVVWLLKSGGRGDII